MRVLIDPLTYRRIAYLLLGAVVLLPYVGLALATYDALKVSFSTALIPGGLLLAAGGVAFLGLSRNVEIVTVRLLLGVPLVTEPSVRPTAEARARSALWFGFHLAAGGVLATLILVGLPLTVLSNAWLAPLSVLAVGYLAAGLGAFAAALAPVLLGPGVAERLAVAQAQARRLAERNRLARELHDSIGHALTATTLQAAAAYRVFESDPEFARRALRSIEEVGRAAMSDLDRALAALRDDDRRTTPEPDLSDLERVCATVRAGGVELACEVTGTVDDLSPKLSQEGYRIVQEGLTNAARHAGPGAVTLAVRVLDDALEILLTNPLGGEPAASSGRGLAGIRERVTLLGGSVKAGPNGSTWELSVWLPR